MLKNELDTIIKFKNEIKRFIGEENINFLKNNYNKKNLCLIYTSHCNFAGIQIRNHMRETFPVIDKYFSEQFTKDNWYHEFEDWLHELIEEVIFE